MINPLSNPSYLLPPLVVTSAVITLMVLVWKKSRRDLSGQLFCGFLLSLALWSLLTFAMRSSPDIHRALPWEKALIVAATAAFVFYYHFTLAYTDVIRKRWTTPALYSFIVAFAILVTTTNLVIMGMRLEDYGYAPIISLLGFLFFTPSVLLIIGGTYNLFKRYKTSSSCEERNRLLYLVLAALLPLIGAGLDGFSNLPPVAIWTNLAFCTICTIAILRYHLLDIRVVARKGLAYLLVSVIIAAPYVIALFVLNRVLHARIEQWWQYVLIILPLAIALRPLYSRAQQWVDKAFYRDRYDYLKELEQFTKEAHDITDFKELGATIVRLAGGALRARNACLLLTSGEGRGLAVVSTLGLDNPPSGTILRNKSILTKWFRSHEETISSNEFDIMPELQSIARTEKQNLARLMPELYVPIKTRRGELTGLLVLGEKLSRQPYSLEDRRLLSTASHQIAVTLENARLYRDAVRARENLEAWLNSMDDGVIISGRDYRIEFANKAAVQSLGISTGDAYPATLGKEAQPPHLITRQDKPIDKCVSHYTINSGDREFDVVAAPISNADGGLSTIEVFRDITERKRAEVEKKEMEQKVQLSDRLASIGEMASGIAHEINNPLTGVIGFSELLMEKDVPEDIRKDLEIIHDGSQRVAGIVRGLLTFARQHKSERTYSDINQLVDNTVALRAYALETSNIRVAVVLDPDLPWTMADAGQLQQVFLNIIINAETEMKKACGKGNLIIKTERIADTIRISFKDDGPGIAKENIGKVFDPFFTTKEVGEGTGLGLSLCHGIITEHSGQLYAESEPGKGATFIIELPAVAEEEREELTGPADEPVKIAGARILVVDDEPTILEFLSHLLAAEGHQVETADNSSDALEMIRSRRYSLILSDIKLPDMSGIELYQHIKKIAPSLTKRVVFITGDVTGSDTRKFLTENKAPYVTKPFDIKQLKEELNRILNRDW